MRYNKVLDIIIDQINNPEIAGSPNGMFKYLMVNYFFREEVSDNKNFNIFLTHYNFPNFDPSINDLREIDVKTISNFINGSDVESSLCGQIMLSKNYLKSFYPNHVSEYLKLPHDIRMEMRANAEERNNSIIAAFEKMHQDIAADKKRKVLSLVALVLVNISRRTGRQLKNTDQSAEKIIKAHFSNYKETFSGNETQMADLNDESIVRDLLKYFFVIKSYGELKAISDMFKDEVERFRKRVNSALS